MCHNVFTCGQNNLQPRHAINTGLITLLIAKNTAINQSSTCKAKYSRTSMALTPLGPGKLVRDRGSSSQ